MSQSLKGPRQAAHLPHLWRQDEDVMTTKATPEHAKVMKQADLSSDPLACGSIFVFLGCG